MGEWHWRFTRQVSRRFEREIEKHKLEIDRTYDMVGGEAQVGFQDRCSFRTSERLRIWETGQMEWNPARETAVILDCLLRQTGPDRLDQRSKTSSHFPSLYEDNSTRTDGFAFYSFGSDIRMTLYPFMFY